jgi:hypothetical protein
MTKLPDGWSVHDNSGPYKEFRRYKALVARHKRAERLRGFRQRLLSGRHTRATRLRSQYRFAAISVLAALASCAATLGLMTLKPWEAIPAHSWPATAMLRHVAAFPNCSAARAVGLAPAYRGQPGYWPQHDRDRDGWACEPYPRR